MRFIRRVREILDHLHNFCINFYAKFDSSKRRASDPAMGGSYDSAENFEIATQKNRDIDGSRLR
jgi:hypothetical protein